MAILGDLTNEEEKLNKAKRRKQGKKERAKLRKLAKKQGKTMEELRQTISEEE